MDLALPTEKITLQKPQIGQSMPLTSVLAAAYSQAGSIHAPRGSPEFESVVSHHAFLGSPSGDPTQKGGKSNVAAAPLGIVPRPRTNEVGEMIRKSKIKSFGSLLNDAKRGDLSGWKLAYELGNGLRRYCLRDEKGGIYDCYEYKGRRTIYDPNMTAVS